MRELVKGFALGIRDLAREAGVLEDLIAQAQMLAALVERSELLAAALDDRAAAVERRIGILADLLRERVHILLWRQLEELVIDETPGEVAHAIGELPQVFATTGVIEAEADFATVRRVQGYARAIFETVLDAGELEPVLAELRSVLELVQSSRELERLLSGYVGGRSVRLRVVDELIVPKVSVRAAQVVRAAVATSAVRPIERVLERLVAYAAELLDRSVAVVRTARELEPEEAQAVREKLQQLARRSVEVDWVVDEALVGGIVAIIGDRQWDRSVRRQLEQARRLVGA
jgi:F-type H+-transporting ATPase subunit delta